MSHTLEEIVVEDDDSSNSPAERMDIFEESQALRACLRFLLRNAEDLDLQRTVQALNEAISAVERDLDRYKN